jgi:hypothetical protein
MADPRRRDVRARGERWEVRASVSTEALDHYQDEAERHGRKRVVHLGRILDGWAQLQALLTPRQRAQLDAALGASGAGELAEVLAELLRQVPRP